MSYDLDPILRVADVVQLLNIAKPTFFRWRRLGQFPEPIHFGPRCVGWRKSIVDAWLAEKAAKRTAAQ
ncbi:AlpA family phage regulatory protein [Pseudomonas aeruginosa]